MSSKTYFIGVDVGTGSVRAALVNKEGKIENVSTHPIITWNTKPKFYEQSSEDIWEACCIVIKVSIYKCLLPNNICCLVCLFIILDYTT